MDGGAVTKLTFFLLLLKEQISYLSAGAMLKVTVTLTRSC